jgi:peptidoglycan/LPS O-acetylase OafA/YrhL
MQNWDISMEPPARPVRPYQPQRLPELDSLRGLASLSVVFHHFKLLWEGRALSGFTQFLYQGPLRLISSGNEAVVLFFVLSGFVLSIPAIHGRAQPYPVFFTRRIFRIYLPYLAALALSVWGAAELHGYVPGTPWFELTWTRPLDWRLVLQHVAFVGTYDATQFNTAFWSLIVEMRVSLIFPVLCALVLWMKPAKSLASAILLSLVSAVLLHRLPQMNRLLAATPHYMGMFVIGIFLARQQKQISRLYDSLSRTTRILIAFTCILLFVYSGSVLPAIMLKLTGRFFAFQSEWLTTLGATGIIVLSLNSNFCRELLLSRPARFLGQVSYSMYLVHGTILFALVHLLYGYVPLLAILPLYLLIVIVVSAVFYRIVEAPAMKWGRRLTSSKLNLSTQVP